VIKNQEIKLDIIDEKSQNLAHDYEQSFAEEALNNMSADEESNLIETESTFNGLENFGVEEEMAPDLFNTENESVESSELLSSEIDEDNSEDDNLEIPAFLRRQKN